MSFQDAETSNVRFAGMTDLLRQALTQANYAKNPLQIFDNLDTDPLVPDQPKPGHPRSRVELLEWIEPRRTHSATLAQDVVDFARKNMLQGPPMPLPPSQVYGHVQSVGALVKAVSHPHTSLSLRDAQAFVNDALAALGNPMTIVQRQRSDFAGIALSKYPIWCYPASDENRPFSEIGDSRASAVDHLGLGCFFHDQPTERLIRWAHQLPDTVPPLKPTAWDANSSAGNVYWRAGGRTFTLSHGQFGVDEIIHSQITGDLLVHPIQVLV